MASGYEITGYVFNSIFLCVLLAVLLLFSVLFSIWFLCCFMAEEDKGCCIAVCPKTIFIICFAICVFGTLLLPWSEISYKLDLVEGWYYAEMVGYQVYFCLVIFIIVCVIPFAICYYESEDPYHSFSFVKQGLCGFCCCCCITLIFGFVFIVTYFFLSRTKVDYKLFHSDYYKLTLGECLGEDGAYYYQPENQSFVVFCSFPLYMVAVIILLGYVFFVCFGGLGMTALPIGCCCAFIKRPTSMDKDTYLRVRESIMKRSQKLLEVGDDIERKLEEGRMSGPRSRVLFQDWKNSSLELCEDWKRVEQSFKMGGAPLVASYCQLCYGGCAFCVSIQWMLQVLLYVAIPEPYNFGYLNYVLNYVDYLWAGFPIVGTTLYGILVWHLMMAVFAGSAVVLGKLPMISVYPLKKGDTMMNSLLVNLWVFLLVSLAVNQFCSFCFQDFAASSVLNIFGMTIQNLQYFFWWYKWTVQYAFLVFCVIGFLYALVVETITCIFRHRTEDEKNVDRVVSNAQGFSLFNFLPGKRRSKEDKMHERLMNINDE